MNRLKKIDSGVRRQVRRVRNSKDGRTVVANFGYLALLQVAGYIFPIITLPYLARVIGADGFGKIAFASAIILWFQTVTDWGFQSISVRDVARCRDDKEMVSEIFSNVFWARVFLMCVSFVLIGLGILFIPKFREEADIILVTAALIPGHIMFPDWFFQAMERMKFTTILNLLVKFIFTAAVFVFIRDKDDYIIQPLLQTVGYLVSGMIAMYIILAKWNVRLRRPSFAGVRDTIKKSTDIFINQIVNNLWNSVGTILLSLWHGDAATGILNAGTRFQAMAANLINVMARAFFPLLCRREDKLGMYKKLRFAISGLTTVALFFCAPLLIHIFYTPEFEEAVVVARIVCVITVATAFSSIYGANVLLLKGRTDIMRRITVVSSLVAFVLMLPAIYYFANIGNAVILVLGSYMLGIGMYVAAKRVVKKEKDAAK